MVVQSSLNFPADYEGSSKLGVSVIIPTFNRSKRLLDTLELVGSCSPPPDEIIVHVDGGDSHTAETVRSAFSQVRILESTKTLGPGGSRNRLLQAARNEIIVSLDDDSFPLDEDFFNAVSAAMEDHPKAGVIAMSIIHDDDELTERSKEARDVAHFVGCGCAYRRSAFLETIGYAPVQPAYGVEEADLALQLLDRGWSVIHDKNLRVRHATSRAHQESAGITAAHISNIALLAFLRYPVSHWPLGTAQVLNRALWSIGKRRFAGIVTGLLSIPRKLWRFRKLRVPVSPRTMRRSRTLARANFDIEGLSSRDG